MDGKKCMIQKLGGCKVEGEQIGFGWSENSFELKRGTLGQAGITVHVRPVWRRLINGA